MISDVHAQNGIAILGEQAIIHFQKEAAQRDLEQQRSVFLGDSDITNVLSPEQERAKNEGEEFKPDLERAKERARVGLEFGVISRLKGAYACYKADREMECLRHLLLAIGSICHALGWSQACAYVNEQNNILYRASKDERGSQ